MAIKLGGGGGSASQINEIVYMNNNANTVTLADGRVYLKGGVFETTVSNYPLAYSGKVPAGLQFYVGDRDGYPTGMVYDGSHFWVVGQTADMVWQYTAAGVSTGTSFSVAGQNGEPMGITWDGTGFWMYASGSGRVYKYSPTGSNTGIQYNLTSQIPINQGKDITWDGTYFYVIALDGGVFKYSSTFSYISTFNVSATTSTQNEYLAWDGTYLWAGGTTNDTAYKFNTSGVYQNESISFYTMESAVRGITFKGGNLFAVGTSTDVVTEYVTAVGIESSQTTVNGTFQRQNQNYVRVA